MPRHTPTQNKVSADINVTPMADIMLVLLIIFMITTPILQSDISLNLPKAQNPLDVPNAEPLVLSLTRDGNLYLGKTRITGQDMAKAFSEILAGETQRIVFLRADQALAYGNVVRLINECRNLGVERIGLMTEKEARLLAQ